MKQIEEKLIERVNQLISKAQLVAGTRYNNSSSNVAMPDMVNSTSFHEWKNNSQNFILLICGEDSPYYENFIYEVKSAYPSDVDHGIGILKALKEDIELGYLTKIKELVSAEIFSDFLEMAEHLLENEYKDPAAFLTTAVLEDGLRKIAMKHGITVHRSDDIGSLNTKIADKGIYNRLLQRQIQAWKGIRDSADHGKFDDYKKEDVEALLSGVQRFLMEYL